MDYHSLCGPSRRETQQLQITTLQLALIELGRKVILMSSQVATAKKHTISLATSMAAAMSLLQTAQELLPFREREMVS